ncbi:MAG: hypothetical protein RJA34_1645 [Pseudomonadota bacterium]|jgi:hypothetical protein
MEEAKTLFAQRLRSAMEAAGYAAKPAVLEREFNTRYWGKPMTLHGVRRWLVGETLPSQDKLVVLAEWLGVQPQDLRYGAELPNRVEERRARWDAGVGYEEREVFEAFLRLPVTQRRVVRDLILTYAKVWAPK